MFRLISLISVACLFLINENPISSYIGSKSRPYYSHSLLELEKVGDENGLETFKYRDVYLNEDVLISRKSFNNGFTLFNIQQPFESSYSDFRITFNSGSSSDPIQLPGIRYFALFVFSKQVNVCMGKVFKEETHANFKIKIDATRSTLIFTFLTEKTNRFFDCFLNTIKNQSYLENSSYFVEILQASEEFERILDDPSSIEVDKLIIRMIYGSLPSFGCESLQISSIFSQSCFKSSIKLDVELPKYSRQIVNSIFKPHAMSAIFIGKLNNSNLIKELSSLTKGKLRKKEDLDYNKINKANMAIKNLTSNIVLRNGFHTNILRLYIPFETYDLESLSSNGQAFILSILNSRHRGGILNFIFMNRFANNVNSYYYSEYTTTILYLEVNLTKKGLQNIPIIIESIASYLNLIKRTVASDKLFAETQNLFNYHLSKSTVILSEAIENYLSSHFIMSRSSSNILNSNINTQFTRANVEHFISKMNLDSITVTLYIPDQLDPLSLITKKNEKYEIFPVETVEPHTNIRVFIFKMADISFNKLSSLSPTYAVDTFGLQLPNNDLISNISLPFFHSVPIFEKLLNLHKSLDIHYKYLKELGSETIISRTMAYKSITTSGIWFSNNGSFSKSVNLELKFSLRKWSPLLEKFNGEVSSFLILGTIHILTAILNIKLSETLYYTNRLKSNIGFIPAQSFSDIISDPFEIFLVVNAPIDYFTLIMNDILNTILSFDSYLTEEIVIHAKRAAKRTLLRLHKGYTQFEKDLKIVTQLVSSQHCSFLRLGAFLENDFDIELVRIVYSSLFASPSIYGLIQGNLTPFHANHILNVFIQGLGHEFFSMEINEENSLNFFNKEVHNNDKNDSNDYVPKLEINTSILDISTIPNEYKSMYTHKLDFTADASYSTVVLLIGQLTVPSIIKASAIKEALSNEISSRVSSDKKIDFASSLSIVANNFVVVSLSIRSIEFLAGTLNRILDKELNQSISKVLKSRKSKSYVNKILENMNFEDNVFETKFLLSKISILNLVGGIREYLNKIKLSDISDLLSDIQTIPRIMIATQKVTNLKASKTSLDFIPGGYKNIKNDYKCLLEHPNTVFN
ncbi:Secreted insulinase like peptidase/M16 peptidase-like Metalloenzyme [Cryptosporidium tyzzeri]|nr:Secreted insulinase like peptidase/M16 peptidase-like Metalloenzyme [Cryptosporidium tyzzeri]